MTTKQQLLINDNISQCQQGYNSSRMSRLIPG